MRRLVFRSGITFAALCLLLAAVTVVGWNVLLGRRPPKIETTETLFQGIQYSRFVRSIPRPLLIHVLTIDLSAPGVRMMVTPPGGSKTGDMPARTTSSFVREFGVQVAINGNFFFRGEAEARWLDQIEEGDPVTVLGYALENRRPYSTDNPDWPALCYASDQASILNSPPCPGETLGALGGDLLILDDVTVRDDLAPASQPEPRTAVAVSQEGKTLWLMVADGRQPGYSEGMTLREMAAFARELGAARCLNLDGGGSSTMVASRDGRPRVLNAPNEGRLPMRERPVANHLGVFARER